MKEANTCVLNFTPHTWFHAEQHNEMRSASLPSAQSTSDCTVRYSAISFSHGQ